MTVKFTGLIFMILLFGAVVSAQVDKDEELSNYKKKSVLLQERERDVLSILYNMTRKQRKLAILKSEQLQKREKLESDVSDLQKNIESVAVQIKSMRRKIATRTRNLYRINAPTIFQSIFGAQSISEMDRNSRILYRLSKSEIDQLRDFRGLKNLLDQQQQSLEEKLSALESTQKDLDAQENNLKTIYFAQIGLLKKLELEDKWILQKLQKMNTASSALSMYAPALENGLYEKKGKLDLPVAGVVSQKFGLLPLKQEKIKVYNKGWFIGCAVGKDVYPVHAGTVSFVGIMEERQNVVILDHGDHFYTIYSNLETVRVSMGDKLTHTDLVGFSGSSRLLGQGLYFEIRHFSQSEDPAEWFDENRLQISSAKENSI